MIARRLSRVLLAVLLGATIAPACRPSLDPAHATRPEGEPRLELSGLLGPARVVTDRYGIPHVSAHSLGDLYYTWGFVTARDRLWQLEYTRRGARGQLWQWMGNRKLRDDGGAQLFELETRAARIWERESRDPAVREPLERFASGVNAYLALCRKQSVPWPDEFVRLGRHPDEWRPQDSVLLLLAQGLVLDLSVPEIEEGRSIREHGEAWLAARQRFENDYLYTTIPDSAARRLYGPSRSTRATPTHVASGPLAPASLPDGIEAQIERNLGAWLSPATAEPERASNVFAVGGARSASGMPLLANDPHLTLGAPGPLYIIHLDVPGQVDAVGATVPGLPAMVSGRNRDCAWGVTALSADVIDVYADTLSADGRSVLSNGRWVGVRQEGFSMRYRVLGVLPIPLYGRHRLYTPHGPVLAVDRRLRIALSARWAGDDHDITLSRLLGLERSRSAPEVAERYRSLITPGLNVVAADREGRVVYQTAGAVPRRGFDPPRGPLPDDGRHEWRGLIPAGAMPAWQAPPNGLIVNCNNLPVGPAYPEPWPRFDWAHDRALRIAGRLSEVPSLTLEDMRSIQNDIYSRGAERFVPRLLRCADSLSGSLSARVRQSLDTLRAWDFVARRDRVAPTLYRAWYGALLKRSRLENLTGLAAAALDGRAPEALPAPGHEEPERAATAALAALEMALAELVKTLGPDLSRWTWARAHRAVFDHGLAWKDAALEPAPVPADGDNSTPCVGRSRLPWSTTFNHGAAFRHLVDLAVTDSSLGLVPPGNSGVRASGHARDLLADWADHRYVPLYLSWERIEAARESELTLAPASAPSRASAARAAAAPR